MSYGQHVTQEEAERIIELYDRKIPQTAIAEMMRRGTRTVRDVLDRAGRTKKYKMGVKAGSASAYSDVIAYDVSRITLVGFSREQAERRMRRFGEHRCEVRP